MTLRTAALGWVASIHHGTYLLSLLHPTSAIMGEIWKTLKKNIALGQTFRFDLRRYQSPGPTENRGCLYLVASVFLVSAGLLT